MARRRDRKQGSFLPAENETLRNPPQFGRWDDPLGYDGRSPGEALLASVRYAVFEGQEQWYHRRSQLVDGRILAGDESHKITKSIRVSDAKVFQGVYTVVNEFNQVVLQVLCFSLRCCGARAGNMFLSTMLWCESVLVSRSSFSPLSKKSSVRNMSMRLPPAAPLGCVHVPFQFPAPQAARLCRSSGRDHTGPGRACPKVPASRIRPHPGIFAVM